METTLIITSILNVFLLLLYLVARERIRSVPVVNKIDNMHTLTNKNFQHAYTDTIFVK
jgi:hypothetical protein